MPETSPRIPTDTGNRTPETAPRYLYTPEEFRAMVDDGNPFIERVQKEGRIIYEKST